MSRASLLLERLRHVALVDSFERIVEGMAHDAEFTGVEFVRRGTHRSNRSIALTVMIDREGGVDVGTCERVASLINAGLVDVEEAYTLEVESAGLNRPLVKPADYQRFAGREAKVVTTLLVKGAKTHRGILRGLRGTNVILDIGGTELPLPVATIKSANLEYDIRADLNRDKKERKHHA